MAGESPNSDSDQERRLDAAIAEFLAAVRADPQLDRDAFLRRYPDLAEPLREFLVDHDRLDQFAEPLCSETTPAAPKGRGMDASTQGFSRDASSAVPPDLERFGDYELIAEIARGGMGVVYRARQTSLSRPVALKMMLSGSLASQADAERFAREAEAAAQLDHPNIVPIYEVGVHDGRRFFTMKLIEGGDLAEHQARLLGDQRAVASLVAAVAEAVHHAHQRGVLHRDLKPRNILLDTDGQPQVTDFGLAKRLDGGSGVTQSGAVLGTAGYMAPEQARGDKSVTTAADVYSLGAVLYELLTGQPPFQAATPAETILLVLDREPTDPRTLRPEVSRDLSTICLKCLEKAAGRRYLSAAALADDLRAWLDGRPIAARPVGNTERLWRWSRRNPLLVATSLFLLFLVAGFSLSLWIENRETRRAWLREGVAAREARQAEQRAQIYLSRSLYEQARVLGMSRPLGSHWQILDLLREAEQLRSREYVVPDAPAADDPRQQLPSVLWMRSEAVSALLQDDARLANRIEMSLAQPALSPGARWVAYFSKTGVELLALGDPTPRGDELAPREYPGIRGTALAVDATGRKLVTFDADSGVLRLWDLDLAEETATLAWPLHRDAVTPAARAPGPVFSSEMSFSPDGRYFTAIHRAANQQTPQTLVIWDLAADRQPRSLVTLPQDTNRGGARFSADSSWLAYATDERAVTCWESQTGRPLHDVRLPLPVIGRLAVSPVRRLMACPCNGEAGEQGVVLLWDLERNQEIRRLPLDSDLRASVVAFGDSGNRLALATRRGRLCVFDLGTGRLAVNLPGAHPFAASVLGWNHRAGRLFSWGVVEGVLKCWELSAPPRVAVRTGLRGGRFALSPDGERLAVAGSDEPGIHVLDRATGSPQRVLLGIANTSHSYLVFSQDGRQLAAIDTAGATVWEVATGRFLARLEQGTGLTGLIASAAFGPEGDLLASVTSRQSPRVAVWDVLRGREVWRATDDVVMETAYLLASGRFLAGITQGPLGSRPKLMAFEIPSGRLVAESELPGEPIDAQSFSPDGQWMATLRFEGADPMFAMFGALGSTHTRAEVVLAHFPDGPPGVAVTGPSTPSASAFSPDSRLLAIGYRDGLVTLCRVSDGATLFQVPLASDAVHQLAFSSDAETLALTNGDGNVQFIHLPTVRRGLAGSGLDW